MKRFFCIFLVAILSMTAFSRADDNGIPDVVLKGFDTYQKFGALSAVETWLAGSAFETADKNQILAKMARVESTYGKLLGFEPLRVVKLAPSMRRVYVGVKYDKGMAWMFFDCYRAPMAWLVTRFDFSTRADEVIPSLILGGD